MAPFELLETMLFDADSGRWAFLTEHGERLQRAARQFEFPMTVDKWEREVELIERTLPRTGQHRVRVSLNSKGQLSWATSPLEPPANEPVRAIVSPDRVHSDNRFLYFKTTRREFYEQQLKNWQERCGCFEVLFLNQRGELTEGSRTNLFVQHDSKILTPPVECGLLDGVYRRHLIESGRAHEQVLYTADLFRADRVYIGNSVRGLIEVEIQEPPSK